MKQMTRKQRAGDLPRGMLREDLVLAVFHCIGYKQEFKMKALTDAMDEAAEMYEGMFLWAKKHPVYQNSRELDDIRGTLLLGGAVTLLGIELNLLKCNPYVSGPYGAKKFQRFSPYQQEIIRNVAARVIELNAELRK